MLLSTLIQALPCAFAIYVLFKWSRLLPDEVKFPQKQASPTTIKKKPRGSSTPRSFPVVLIKAQTQLIEKLELYLDFCESLDVSSSEYVSLKADVEALIEEEHRLLDCSSKKPSKARAKAERQYIDTCKIRYSLLEQSAQRSGTQNIEKDMTTRLIMQTAAALSERQKTHIVVATTAGRTTIALQHNLQKLPGYNSCCF